MSSYGLDSAFERIVAQLAATRPKFWTRIGHALDIECIENAAAKIVLKAVAAITENGQPPSASTIVRQRIRSWLDKGRLSTDEAKLALALLDDADEDADAFGTEEVVAELVPVVRRQMEKRALDEGLRAFGQQKDLTQISDILSQAYRLGSSEHSLGSRLGAASMEQIEYLRTLKRLPTGISELDAALAGGMERGSLGLFVGPTGSGKSMSLGHVGCNAATNGLSVAYATLELGVPHIFARLIGNLAAIPSEDILNDPRSMDTARKRMQLLEDRNMIGQTTVRYFTAHATTVDDLRDWLEEEEKASSRKIDLLCVDYATLLSEPSKKLKHEELTSIAEKLRALAADKNIWIWSAAQSNAEAQHRKTKKIDSHHTAGSMGLPRTADLVITLNPRDEGSTMMFRIAKNRYGRAGEDVGPLPHEFEMGRVSPVLREGWPWQ